MRVGSMQRYRSTIFAPTISSWFALRKLRSTTQLAVRLGRCLVGVSLIEDNSSPSSVDEHASNCLQPGSARLAATWRLRIRATSSPALTSPYSTRSPSPSLATYVGQVTPAERT